MRVNYICWQWNLLEFIQLPCFKKGGRSPRQFFTDYRDIKFKFIAYRLDSENSNTVLSNKNYRKTAPKITQFNRSIKLLNRLESSRGSFDALNKVKQRCIATIVFVSLSGLWHILNIWKFHLLKKKLAIGKKKEISTFHVQKKNLASLKSPPPPLHHFSNGASLI